MSSAGPLANPAASGEYVGAASGSGESASGSGFEAGGHARGGASSPPSPLTSRADSPCCDAKEGHVGREGHVGKGRPRNGAAAEAAEATASDLFNQVRRV